MDERPTARGRHGRSGARCSGDAHVDRAVAATTPLTAEFQDLITRYAWGEIWTRPGLDVRSRRILVIGTMVALGRWEELRMHVRAALDAWRVHRRRHQGDPAAAGGLLRRARGQSRLCRGRSDPRRTPPDVIARTSRPQDLPLAPPHHRRWLPAALPAGRARTCARPLVLSNSLGTDLGLWDGADRSAGRALPRAALRHARTRRVGRSLPATIRSSASAATSLSLMDHAGFSRAHVRRRVTRRHHGAVARRARAGPRASPRAGEHRRANRLRGIVGRAHAPGRSQAGPPPLPT